jgi:hypothetical protein
MAATVTYIGAPLQYIPVLHTCGHFELRLTRWNGFDPSTAVDPANADGFLRAGNRCASESNDGRGAQANYATLEDAQAAALVQNAGRGGA